MKSLYLLLLAVLLLVMAAGEKSPAPQAIVEMEWSNGVHEYGNYTLTGSDGYYEMNVAKGNINVSAGMSFERGHELLTVVNGSHNLFITETKWQNFTLFMPVENAKVYGHVYDNSTHAPIEANVSIYFEALDKTYYGLNYTLTQNGYYEMWLPAGNVSMVVSASGYQSAFHDFVISSGEEREIDFYLDALPPSPPLVAWIEGYIKDDGGNPIEKAEVMAIIHNQSYNSTSFNYTVTSADGYYKFKVPVGDGMVYASSDNFFSAFSNVSTEYGGVTWANLTLQSVPPDNAWVSGYVRDGNGNPIANANVTVRGSITVMTSITTYFERYGTTDVNGHYNISVPSVPYVGIPFPPISINYSSINEVLAHAENYFDNETSLSPPSNLIQPGQTLHVDVTLDKMPPENCTLKGFVYISTQPLGHILYVGGSGPDNYTTIQDAINAANNGDTIKVYPGVYDGPIIINKEVKLIGDPSIDGHGGDGIKIEANNVSIENFTIFNCSYGIYAHNDSFIIHNITIGNCTIYNTSENGIKLYYVENGTIMNSTIYDTSNLYDGIYCIHTSNISITGNHINNASGDGIYIASSYGNIIQSNHIYFNAFHGLTLRSSKRSKIYSNYVYNNGDKGIWLSYSCNNNISFNHVYSNNWEGIYLHPSSNNNTIFSNYVYDNLLTGIFIGNSSNNNAYQNIIYNNNIGIVIFDAEKNYIENNTVFSNELWGIAIQHSNNNSIEYNRISNHTKQWNSAGIVVFSQSNYNNISSNVVYNNGIDNIEIWNNSSHNMIWNNTVYNATYGILLSRNASHNAIAKNSIYENEIGIGIGHSNSTWGGSANNNIVWNNTIYNNGYGIQIYASSHNFFAKNNVFSNTHYGFSLQYSLYNALAENVADSNKIGFDLYYSHNNMIINNTANSNSGFNIYGNPVGYGIRLSYSGENILSGNIANSNYHHGIFLYNSSHNILFANTANSNGQNGFDVYYHSNLNNFGNNTANLNGRRGFFIHVSSGNFIANSIAMNNNFAGIEMEYAGDTVIYNSTLMNNGKGIYFYQSSSNIMGNNTISQNEYGIYLQSSANNAMFYNEICNNTEYGVFVDSGSINNSIYESIICGNRYGVYVSTNNTIASSNIASNSNYGIYVSGNNNLILNNTIQGNAYGIYLSSSYGNIIFNNYFNNSVNAWDNGNNIWNISKREGMNIVGGAWLGGNYWHDYAGIDTDGDGLGDTLLPYNCSGNIVNGGDMHPLLPMLDKIPPEIVSIAFPSKAHVGSVNITCNVFDNTGVAGVWINITLPNGSYINESMQYNGIYYFNASLDSTGIYSFHIYAIDGYGNANKSNTMQFHLYPPWDLNLDGTINVLDLIMVAMHFGSHEGDENYAREADLTGDGTINVLDLIVVAGHFGEIY